MVEKKMTKKEWEADRLKEGVKNRITILDQQIKKLQDQKKDFQKQL